MFKCGLASSPINNRLLVWMWLQALLSCILAEVVVILFVGVFGLIISFTSMLKQLVMSSILVLIGRWGEVIGLWGDF